MDIITISSRQNPLMVQTAKLLSSRRQRQNMGLMVGDGTKLLSEAVRWAPELLDTVILQEGLNWPELPGHVRRVRVSEQLMKQVSSMEAPEGALFLMRIPPETETTVKAGTLVLDGIQDPGNLGTILRTADALDVHVLLTDGCVDPYNPKTVRAAMGAIFRSPPRRMDRENLIRQCRERGIPLLVTALSETAEDIRGADLKAGVVVIGSEGQGVSDRLCAASDRQLIIPMHPRCESLNAAVAAAIVLWQMTTL